MFDAKTGVGVSPPGCHVSQYAVKVEDGDVYIDHEATPDTAG
jgi:nitrite reductase/ring-hydroxylating ferredoxin subunit